MSKVLQIWGWGGRQESNSSFNFDNYDYWSIVRIILLTAYTKTLKKSLNLGVAGTNEKSKMELFCRNS